MTKPDVLLMYPTRPKAMAQLEALYTLHRYDEAEDKMAFLAEHGAKITAISTNGHAELGAAHLAHMPNLGLVSCSSAGFESIDDAALKARGIALTNTSVALRDDVADCALMLVLACRRHLIAGHAYVRTGDWGRKGMYPLTSAIRGKKAGIVGLGSIGQAIADRLEVLGMEIGYTGRKPKPVHYTFHDSAESLAAWSDVLVVVVPGGPETEGLIDAAVLAALGPQGTLINVARGSVVDETALIAALENGTLGSAGLDVFRGEPNPDPALVAAPNLTLYPHHASGTIETRDAMAQLMVDNLAAHFAGRPLLTPVYTLPEGT
ncbi:2-hydroxyacid dehydrogenase [Tropicibacter sp. S64]|uniref:2-hydroxyacid dehydrogenase n=1 Tax=Tropicibacter sp. S64 TaxID=3415122 RepID=UPI003C7A8C42